MHVCVLGFVCACIKCQGSFLLLILVFSKDSLYASNMIVNVTNIIFNKKYMHFKCCNTLIQNQVIIKMIFEGSCNNEMIVIMWNKLP